jgi:hypothetical protein
MYAVYTLSSIGSRVWFGRVVGVLLGPQFEMSFWASDPPVGDGR